MGERLKSTAAPPYILRKGVGLWLVKKQSSQIPAHH